MSSFTKIIIQTLSHFSFGILNTFKRKIKAYHEILMQEDWAGTITGNVY